MGKPKKRFEETMGVLSGCAWSTHNLPHRKEGFKKGASPASWTLEWAVRTKRAKGAEKPPKNTGSIIKKNHWLVGGSQK